MSSTKIASTETYEELSYGISELLEKEEQLAAQLQLTRDRLAEAETVVETLRNNRDSLKKLLKIDIIKLNTKDKVAGKLKKRLRTLQHKAEMAVDKYETPHQEAATSVLTPEESAALLTTTPAVEDAFNLLTSVEVLRHEHLEIEKAERKRLFRLIIMLIALPVAGFIVGLNYNSFTVRPEQTPVIVENEITKKPSESSIGKSNEKTVEEPVEQQETTPVPRIYTVNEGDTLSGIAKSLYGESKEWEKIYQANTETLSDPHKLSVGQDLLIP